MTLKLKQLYFLATLMLLSLVPYIHARLVTTPPCTHERDSCTVGPECFNGRCPKYPVPKHGTCVRKSSGLVCDTTQQKHRRQE